MSVSLLRHVLLDAFRDGLSLRLLLFGGLVIRAVLLLYGEWQDSQFAVKFTDIDYHVFSDASRHVIEGRSPFLRPTYRYTPLLAFMLVPNHLLIFSFGKILFIICDLVVGFIIDAILRVEGVNAKSRGLAVGVWLLNPLTATVSARGNAESFLAVLVLFSLLCLLHGWTSLSAVTFGAVVHIKIFPIIYPLPILLYLRDKEVRHKRGHSSSSSYSLLSTVLKLPTIQELKFAALSAAVFLSLTGFFYSL